MALLCGILMYPPTDLERTQNADFARLMRDATYEALEVARQERQSAKSAMTTDRQSAKARAMAEAKAKASTAKAKASAKAKAKAKAKANSAPKARAKGKAFA